MSKLYEELDPWGSKLQFPEGADDPELYFRGTGRVLVAVLGGYWGGIGRYWGVLAGIGEALLRTAGNKYLSCYIKKHRKYCVIRTHMFQYLLSANTCTNLKKVADLTPL